MYTGFFSPGAPSRKWRITGDRIMSSQGIAKPIWCRPKEGARLAGCGIVKFYELLNSGLVESTKIDGMRLCRVASIERLGEQPDTPAAA
jgi:hypothetical protein